MAFCEQIQVIGERVRSAALNATAGSELYRDLRRLVLSHFVETGDAPTSKQIMAAMGISGERCTEALRNLHRGDVLVFNDGRIESAYPFSGLPSYNRIQFASGVVCYAMCATDAFGAHFMTGQEMTVTSRCPHCNEAIVNRLQDGRVVEGQPDEPVEYLPTLSGCGAVAQMACPSMNFFCNEGHLEAWCEAHDVAPGGAQCRRDEVLAHGKWIFGDFLRI